VKSVRTKGKFRIATKTKHKQKICVFVLLCHNWELHRDAINKIKSFLNKQNFSEAKRKSEKERNEKGKSYQQRNGAQWKSFCRGFVSRLFDKE
jgi:aspartyl aminopeptidase